MMGDIGRAYADAIWSAIVIAFLAGAGTATFLILGVPWMWGFVKPWLHRITG